MGDTGAVSPEHRVVNNRVDDSPSQQQDVGPSTIPDDAHQHHAPNTEQDNPPELEEEEIREEMVSEQDFIYVDGNVVDGNGEKMLVMDEEEYHRFAQENHLATSGDSESFIYETVDFSDCTNSLAMFEMYQPIELDGHFMCRICYQTGKQVHFATRAQYSTHRYKCHGTFMNSLICPVDSCRETFASLNACKKHLQMDHSVPIETHHKIFRSMAEFKEWTSLVEVAGGCKFIMHNKQQGSRRQVLHCLRSEHKCSSLSMKRLKSSDSCSRMSKEGSVCPAHISYTVEKDGTIDCIYQMVHYGHSSQVTGTFQVSEPTDKQMGHTTDVIGDESHTLTTDYKLPKRPPLMGQRPMQYLQMDIVEMSVALYGMNRYTHILLITDLKTKFMWARPLQDSFDRNHVVRLLTDIFTQFGVPEGYSASMSFELIRDSIEVMSFVFKTEIVEIGNQTPDYVSFRKTLYDTAATELNNRDRWAEIVPFVTMHYNQQIKHEQTSPFELMFGRSQFPVYGEVPQWFNHEEPPKVGIKFQVDDRVFMRNFDASSKEARSRAVEDGSDAMLCGCVGEVDWNRGSFPYKVYFSTDRDDTEHWPDKSFPFMWVSQYDLAPTSIDMLMMRDADRRTLLNQMMCGCQNETSSGGRCNLFRAEFCLNGMSRTCCDKSSKFCDFHDDYNNGEGDTYQRLQLLYRKFRAMQEEDMNRPTREQRAEKKKMEAERRRLLRLWRARREKERVRRINVESGIQTTLRQMNTRSTVVENQGTHSGVVEQDEQVNNEEHPVEMVIETETIDDGESVVIQEVVQVREEEEETEELRLPEEEIDKPAPEMKTTRIEVDGQVLNVTAPVIPTPPQPFSTVPRIIRKRKTTAITASSSTVQEESPNIRRSTRETKKNRLFEDFVEP